MNANSRLLLTVLIIVFAVLMVGTKSESFGFLDDYVWVKYEHNGKRTDIGDDLFIKFHTRTNIADIQLNDTLNWYVRFVINEQDSIIYFCNMNYIFLDSTIYKLDLIKCVLNGKTDMNIYPVNIYNMLYGHDFLDTTFQKKNIYLKQKHPNQY